MRILALPLALMLGLATPMAANAGIYSDDLSRCLVAHTGQQDQIVMARWIFGVMAAHPGVSAIAKVDDAARTANSRTTAQLFQTLLTESCKDETAKAVKYEGADALKTSFKVLGEIAMQTLLADPKVTAESQAFAQYIDEAKMKAVMAPQQNEPGTAPKGSAP